MQTLCQLSYITVYIFIQHFRYTLFSNIRFDLNGNGKTLYCTVAPLQCNGCGTLTPLQGPNINFW
jgi:hypothetical protein